MSDDPPHPLSPVVAPHLHASAFHLVSAGSEVILLLGQAGLQFGPEGVSDQPAMQPVAIVHMNPVTLKELGVIISQFVSSYEEANSIKIRSQFLDEQDQK